MNLPTRPVPEHDPDRVSRDPIVEHVPCVRDCIAALVASRGGSAEGRMRLNQRERALGARSYEFRCARIFQQDPFESLEKPPASAGMPVKRLAAGAGHAPTRSARVLRASPCHAESCQGVSLRYRRHGSPATATRSTRIHPSERTRASAWSCGRRPAPGAASGVVEQEKGQPAS